MNSDGSVAFDAGNTVVSEPRVKGQTKYAQRYAVEPEVDKTEELRQSEVVHLVPVIKFVCKKLFIRNTKATLGTSYDVPEVMQFL